VKSNREGKLDTRENFYIHGTNQLESQKLGPSLAIRNNVKLIGIVNCTPDSFYDGGRYDPVEQALRLAEEGADILDIGGESSRPGAAPVAESVEKERVLPVIRAIHCQLSLPISIDTYHPAVAEAALEAGASFINDISGLRDPAMRRLAADSGAQVCVMHMHGEPKTMQESPSYPNGVVQTVLDFFARRVDQLLECGVKEEQIVLDPGIGFGKTVDHNVEIVNNLSLFKRLGFPILFGASRKSFMTKILKKPANDLLSATMVVNTIALRAGADLIRVHDVREHRDLIDLLEYMGGGERG